MLPTNKKIHDLLLKAKELLVYYFQVLTVLSLNRLNESNHFFRPAIFLTFSVTLLVLLLCYTVIPLK